MSERLRTVPTPNRPRKATPSRRTFLYILTGLAVVAIPATISPQPDPPRPADPHRADVEESLHKLHKLRGLSRVKGLPWAPHVAQATVAMSVIALGQVESWGTRVEIQEARACYDQIRPHLCEALGREPMLSDLEAAS